MNEREQLENAIANLNTQRGVLGDASVDAAITGLRQKIADLDGPGAEQQHEIAATEGEVDYPPDHRPNSGLFEGDISHNEVNEVLRKHQKVILFGQQIRLRQGVLMNDKKLSRVHPGHRLTKFFYGAVRQLPGRLVEALLDKHISVTMVRGTDLLVFHSVREHQAFHTGRTRRTIYLPEIVLTKAFEAGYDYWAISQIVIRETWPLLDYLLIFELINRCQYYLRNHHTLGYHFIKENLRENNKHRLDRKDDVRETKQRARGVNKKKRVPKKRHLPSQENDDEFSIFFKHYAARFFALDHSIVHRDPYEVTDEIFDERREQIWAHQKLEEICQLHRYPTYFAIDRDIVHQAAFHRAEERGMSLEPQNPEEVMHDLWDQIRFHNSRTIRTEKLLDLLVSMGADGIRNFIATVAEERTFGYQGLTRDRDDLPDFFKRMLQGYSTTKQADLPGCLGYHFKMLYAYYLQNKRCELLARFKESPSESQAENASQLKDVLVSVIEKRLHPDRVPDFKQRIEFSNSSTALVQAAEELLQPKPPEIEKRHICGLLAKLDRHPLYHSKFLAQCRQISGDEEIVFEDNIQPEIDRLLAYIPDQAYNFSSDPQGVTARLFQFQQLLQQNPHSKTLFTLLAAVLLRLDLAENYYELMEHVEAIGEYATPALREIVDDEQGFNDEERGAIRTRARELLDAQSQVRQALESRRGNQVETRS